MGRTLTTPPAGSVAVLKSEFCAWSVANNHDGELKLQSKTQQLHDILNDCLSKDIIDDVTLPDFLNDPKTKDEINDRFYLIYYKLFGPLCKSAKESLGRELSKNESGFIAERLQAYLKQKGGF